jgi:hypothetical protein
MIGRNKSRRNAFSLFLAKVLAVQRVVFFLGLAAPVPITYLVSDK